MGITRDDSPGEEYEPTDNDLSIGGFLDSLLAPFATELDLATVSPRQGAGFQLVPATRKLTLEGGATCLLTIPRDLDEDVRSATLELTAGVSVAVLSWGAEDDKPDDDEAQSLKRRQTMGLAFLEEGGRLEITNASNSQAVLTFR